MLPPALLQLFGDSVTNFLRNVRIVDVLDITLISLFLYIVFNWLRQNASSRSFISLGVLLVIYVFARFTDMYLTELLIQGIFVIILIGLVVVFQSDMRRLVDRLGNWSFLKNNASSSSAIATSTITEAAIKMAEKKTGALIVIKGEENWDRHMHGGITLQGSLTIPLLLSIFNKYAPGHDGAVLLEADTITKFGVHLPLSTNLHKMDRGGTRHTAALGIAEQCDALVVVVSEERGAISVAQNGAIQELDSSSDLKKRLDDFWSEHYSGSGASFTQWWKRRSLRTALASVVLSVVLWLSFAYPWETAIRSFEVPIEFRNLNATELVLQDSIPAQAGVRVSGSDQAFRTLDPAGLVISFDLAREKITNGQLQIRARNINLPADLSFFEATPSTIQLHKARFDTLIVRVYPQLQGRLRPGLQLLSATALPDSIQLLAGSDSLRVDSIALEPINLGSVQNNTTLQKRLLLPEGDFQLPQESSGQVRIRIEVEGSN